ncbi:MAG: adenosine kinase, partial [Nitrospinales bacterium]
ILVTPDSERTMLTHLGISSSIHRDNVDETIVKNSKLVYIEGYLWMEEETRHAALKMAAIAKKEGIPVAFTLSDAFVIDQHQETLVDFIRWNVDILFCNEVEGLALIKNSDPKICFAEMRGMAGTVFMTRGSQGAWAGNSDNGKVSVDVFPVKVVDTTGAGDLFAAGALYGLLKKHDLRESAIIGSYCAGQVVTHMGGRMPVHAHTDVQKILQSYNGA